MKNFNQWMQLAIAAVMVAEGTVQGVGQGEKKKGLALKMVGSEIATIGITYQPAAPIANAAVNMIVLGNNISGLFQRSASSSSGAGVGGGVGQTGASPDTSRITPPAPYTHSY